MKQHAAVSLTVPHVDSDALKSTFLFLHAACKQYAPTARGTHAHGVPKPAPAKRVSRNVGSPAESRSTQNVRTPSSLTNALKPLKEGCTKRPLSLHIWIVHLGAVGSYALLVQLRLRRPCKNVSAGTRSSSRQGGSGSTLKYLPPSTDGGTKVM
jgi:hypothetical protein